MKQQVAWEREIAELTVKMTEQKAAREKDIVVLNAAREKDVAVLEERLAYANQEALRSKGLLTSRGVLEFALKQVHHERNGNRKFIARSTCEDLDESPPLEKTEAWKMKECFEMMCKQYPGSILARMSLGKAYAEVYSALSYDIHGYPWSGESVMSLGMDQRPLCVGRPAMARRHLCSSVMLRDSSVRSSEYCQ